ncbi:MAG: proprotein convertase P-domain-containing protein [Kofleriaceae bacterium]|nr:proprotein convertase P-domain-containing protein [Kofleriaceae bacterium]
MPTEGDGKDDSQRRPTDHGDLAFATSAIETLSDTAKFHAWQFELSGDAEIDASTTYAVLGQRRVDTVLYLYKEGPGGWGPYISRNDDDGASVYSRVKRTLGAGRYRVLVKGFASTTRGRFAVKVDCDGAGCAPAVTGGCLFGESYQDAFETAALTPLDTQVLSLAHPERISPFDHDRIVRAVQQSSHADVTTWQDALGRVDGGEVNRTFFLEPDGRRMFVAYEYGAGDNSYGAFFDHHSSALVASIRDADLEGCNVTAETCLLAASYPEVRADPAYSVSNDRYITATSQLEPREAAQALATFRAVYGEVADLAAGLAMVDEGSLRFTSLVHNATNTELVAVEFGAGDTSVGRLYYGTSLQVAAGISDSSIEACNWFAARTPGQATAGQGCRAQSDCATGLQCEGTFANSGTCVMHANLPGEGNECASDAACGNPGLVCAGVTRGYGLCGPAWMRATFADPTSAGVPDGGTLVRAIAARGLATVDTDVVLSLRIAHPRAAQLKITLTNPAGNEVLVYDGVAANNGAPFVLTAKPILGFSGDESVNGEWTLRVTDRTSGHVGTLEGWQLTLTSRWD